MLEEAEVGQEEAAVEIENQEEPEAVAPVASKEMAVAAAKATVATLAMVYHQAKGGGGGDSHDHVKTFGHQLCRSPCPPKTGQKA